MVTSQVEDLEGLVLLQEGSDGDATFSRDPVPPQHELSQNHVFLEQKRQ